MKGASMMPDFYPPQKKQIKKWVRIAAVAALAVSVLAGLYIRSSWGDQGQGWLLTQKHHQNGGYALYFEMLPSDQYQDVVARAMVAQLTGDTRTLKKSFSGQPFGLLPPGNSLRVTQFITGEEAEGKRIVTVIFEEGSEVLLTVEKSKDKNFVITGFVG